MASPTTNVVTEDTLTCPRDGSPMRPFVIADVTVDRCHTCDGLWLDQGELRRVTHDGELETLASRLDHLAPPTIRCPRCSSMCLPSSVEGVELDACARCGGLWLDRDELKEARTRVMVRDATARPSALRRLLDRL